MVHVLKNAKMDFIVQMENAYLVIKTAKDVALMDV
jgi:hypothetical protein